MSYYSLTFFRTKLKTFQIQINLEPEQGDSSADPSSFKTKPQFLKRRSVQKIGVECDPCEKKVTVNSDCVKHVKLGHEGSTVPRVLTRRQSSGRDLLGLAKTQTGMTRALTRRQSGGRQDLLGLDQRRNSCGKTTTQREARNALRLASKSGVEIDKENTSTLNRLSAISIGNGEDQDFSEFERSALLAHNKYRIRHGVCLLKLDRKVPMFEYEEQSRILVCYSFVLWLRTMQTLWQLQTLFNTGIRSQRLIQSKHFITID